MKNQPDNSMRRRLYTGAFSILAIAVVGAAGCKAGDNTVMPTGTAVHQYTANIQMAYDPSVNANPNCFVDLDNGAVYNVQNAPAHAADIDLIWYERICSNDGCIGNPQSLALCSGSVNGFTKSTLGISSWSITNNTQFVRTASAITIADFNAVKNVDDLVAAYNKDEPYLNEDTFHATPGELSNVWAFLTPQHKRGLILITSATFNQGSSVATLSIKVEP